MLRSAIYISMLLVGVLIFGCEKGNEEISQDSIVKKIEKEESLNKSEKCIVDSIISSIVDPRNVLVYASAFDVLGRYSITEAASQINFCRPMIQGSSGSDLLADMAEQCPARLKSLSSKDLDALHTKAIELSKIASDFKGSVFEFAYGACVKHI